MISMPIYMSTLMEGLGWLAVPATVMLFVSPVEACLKIYKSKEIGGFSPVPYFATLVNTLIWITYALIKGDIQQVLLVNSVGCCSAVLSLSVFLMYSTEKIDLAIKTIAAVGFCAAAYSISVALSAHVSQITMLGIIGTCTSCAMFGGPLAVAAEVVKTESVEFLPLMPSIFAFLATSLWTSYGALKGDLFIVLGNGPGCLLAAVQLALYWRYSKGSTSNLDEKTSLVA